ncbi:hypothetical protein SNE40_021009 [Patella caerulea]|uniref:Tetraspanin n=1 Tax=Patella caerulea TaxID=87958 RepID=A0AAN8G2B2_PATCE
MGFCASFGRIILILLNVIILLVAVTLAVVGVILKFFPGKIFDVLLNVITSSLASTLPFHIPDTLEFLPLVDDLGVALIAIGCFLFIFSFVACCGACCEWRIFLIVFVISMSVIIIAQAVVGGLFIAKDSPIHKTIKNKLEKELQSDYTGSLGEDMFSLLLNLLMFKMECCGIEGPSDFLTARHWKETFQNIIINNAKVPAACCDQTTFSQLPDLQSCVLNGNVKYINSMGCYYRLYEYVDDNRLVAILGLCAVLLIQITLVVFGIVIIRQIGEQKILPI